MRHRMIPDLVSAGGDLLHHVRVRLYPYAAQKERRLDPMPVERVQDELRLVRVPRRVDRQRDRFVLARDAVHRHLPRHNRNGVQFIGVDRRHRRRGRLLLPLPCRKIHRKAHAEQ